MAAIAAIELSKGRWESIITCLSSNAASPKIEYRISALETLWYICEEVPKLDRSQNEIILTAIIPNLSPEIDSDEIRIPAVTAFGACVKYSERQFEQTVIRDALLSLILSNCDSRNSRLRSKAVQCLLEIVNYQYDLLDVRCISRIETTTFGIIKADKAEDVVLLAIEVWCSICDEEITRMEKRSLERASKGLIETAAPALLPVLLESLKKSDPESEGDWTIPVAAACCISLLAEILKDIVIEPIMNFVVPNTASTDWKCKNGALLALAAILKGPNKKKMMELADQAIPMLINFLKDPKQEVRETTAWVFSKIAIYFPNIIKASFNEVISSWLETLSDKPKISYQICMSFCNLFENLVLLEDDSTNVFSPCFRALITNFWANAFRPDACSNNANLVGGSFTAMTSLINIAAQDTYVTVNEILRALIENLEKTINGSFCIPDKALFYQCFICSCLQPVLNKLAGKIAQPVADAIMSLVLNSFKIRGMIYDEGVCAISGVIVAMGKYFLPYMHKYMECLTYSLEQSEDSILNRAALNSVIDLARALGAEISTYLGAIAPLLMGILRNEDMERSIKLLAISATSDVALIVKHRFEPYLAIFLEFLLSATRIIMNPMQEVDSELRDYLKQLTECIIETYTVLVYAVDDVDSQDILQRYVDDIFKFLGFVGSDLKEADISLIKDTCGLVGDLANLYKGKITRYLSMPYIKEMIDMVKCVGSVDCVKHASWVNNAISNAVNQSPY